MQEETEYRGKDVSVSQRQIYILSLLSENPKGYRADEIQERLRNWDIDVSRRTISRDIDELSLNYSIGEEERNGKIYYFADKYTLKNVDFTIEDLVSLAFTKEMLKEYEHLDMGRHAITFIEKIVESSAALNKLQFESLCGHFRWPEKKSRNTDRVDSKIEKTIQNAIDSRRKICIDYYSFTSDECTRRIIHPYRLLLIDSYFCVEGYCELRKEVRRFRISRIMKIEILDVKFELGEKENELQESQEAFLELTGRKTEDIELLFTGESIRYVKEYEAKRAKRIEEREEGLYFYQKAAVAPDVVRWVRGFGAEVEVIKPRWLKQQLADEARMRLKNGNYYKE